MITGAHPEYATAELLDALEAHVDGGGALAYLGGNGLNGRVSVDPERPHVLELRRNETQGLAWQALPGEHHHAATGAYGGDWRRQERPEHRFLGVGLSAFGEAPGRFIRARRRQRRPGGGDRLRRTRPGGPDRSPRRRPRRRRRVRGRQLRSRCSAPPPTPPCSPRRAVGAEYSIWPDDVRDTEHAAPKRRADIVLRLPPAGGTVFSVGSIAWSGCLGDDEANPIARITENVLRELARERPFEAARG